MRDAENQGNQHGTSFIGKEANKAPKERSDLWDISRSIIHSAVSNCLIPKLLEAPRELLIHKVRKDKRSQFLGH